MSKIDTSSVRSYALPALALLETVIELAQNRKTPEDPEDYIPLDRDEWYRINEALRQLGGLDMLLDRYERDEERRAKLLAEAE